MEQPNPSIESSVVPINEITNSNPLLNLEKTLNSIFPTQQEETKVTKARNILGNTLGACSDEQLETHIAQFEFLVNSCLDLFERELFDGKTLKELTG
jgi:hypothetical protein